MWLNQKILAFLAALLFLGACAQAPQVGEQEVRYGRITRVETVQVDSPESFGLGAIVGALAGGLLGNQIGKGTGRDVATVAGVLAGGYAGSAVQSKTEKQVAHHITIQLKNGVTVAVTQPVTSIMQVGDEVRIDGSGTSARVVNLTR